MRVFALRLLLGWWMVPLVWLIAWPMAFLMFGAHDANEIALEVSDAMWNGA